MQPTSVPGTERPLVLVVDDDVGTRLLIQAVLESSGFRVAGAESGAEALPQLREREFDAVLLDRVLPDVDGVDILPAVRAAAPAAAVLMLSAVDDVQARITALRTGADDFLTKPFHVSEVVARIEAVRRRGSHVGEDPDVIRYHDLVLDRAARRATRDGSVLPLTPTELRLLWFLAENRERVLSRGQILESVWQYDFGGGGEVVEKAVSNLRKKVDAGRPPLIQTVRGFGYCLRVEE